MASRKKQAQSVFLTVIMVLSVVAMGTAGLAGTAAAQEVDYDGDNIDVGFTTSLEESEEVIAGSEGQELGLLVLEDKDQSAFSTRTNVELPEGFTFSDSLTEEDILVSVNQDGGNIEVDDWTLTDDQTLRIDHSGTSAGSDQIRISGLVVDTQPDIEADQATGSATNAITVDYAIGEEDADVIEGFKPEVTTDEVGPIPAAGSTALTDTLEVTTGDTADDPTQIASGTNVVIGANESEGISFDASQIDPGAVSGDEKIDADGIEVTQQEITLPVTDDFTGAETLELNENEIYVSAEGSAPATSAFEATVEPVDSTGVVEADNTGAEFDINRPTLDHDSITLTVAEDQQAVGASVAVSGNTDQTVLRAAATANDQMPAGSTIEFETNNSAVTFDEDQEEDLDVIRYSDSDDAAEIITDNGAEVNIDGSTLGITLPDNIDDLSHGSIDDSDEIYVGTDDAETIRDGAGASQDLSFNVTGAPADGTDVGINVTTGEAGTVVSEETDGEAITLERAGSHFNDGDAATVYVDNTGEENVLIEPDDTPGSSTAGVAAENGLVIDLTSVTGDTQIAQESNITVELDQDSDITFDTSVGTSAGSTHTADGETVGVESVGGSGDVDVIHVTDTEIDIGIDDGGDVTDSLTVDRLLVNATADATNSSVTVTYDTGDDEVVEVFDDAIEPVTDEVDDVTLSPGTGAPEVNEVAESNVEVDGNELSDQSNADDASYAGADVELTLTDQPSETDFEAADLVTDTNLVTDEDGVAEFNFSAPRSGNYEITANASGVEDTTTYNVEAGDLAAVEVEGVENAFRGGTSGPENADNVPRTGVYNVTPVDAEGNVIDNTNLNFDIDVQGGSLVADGAYQDLNADGTVSGGDAIANDRVDFTINDGVFHVVVDSATAGDVTIDITPIGDEAGVEGDDGSVTLYDFADDAELELETETADGDETVNGTATVVDSSGDVIDVPHIPVDEFASDNTSVADITGEDTATNADGEAEVTLETDEIGEANITATFAEDPEADADAEATLTVGEDEGDGEEHESGVSQELYDAADQDGDGDLARDDVRNMIQGYAQDGSVEDVDITRDNVRDLIQYYAQQ